MHKVFKEETSATNEQKFGSLFAGHQLSAEIRFDVDTAVGLLSDAVSKESGSLTSAGGGAGNNAEFIFGFICGGGGGKAQSHCSKC